MIVVSVTATGGELSVAPRFVDVGEDVDHKPHVLPDGFSYLGVAFTEWKSHVGQTVRVSQDQKLVPVTASELDGKPTYMGNEVGLRKSQLTDDNLIREGSAARH
jgi:hypothetical protein